MYLQVKMSHHSPQAKPSNPSDPLVSDMDIEGKRVGQIVLELFAGIVPKTSENFVHCVQEEKTLDPSLGNFLTM